MEISAMQLISQAGYVVKVVLAVLLFFSILSWTVIFYKWRYFSTADKESIKFIKIYNTKKDINEILEFSKKYSKSPLARLYSSIYSEGSYIEKEKLKRSIKRYCIIESANLEKYLHFLATTGSTTPFIGLFGTVWGIMNAFSGIGTTGSASLAVVAPGIAEALIATAMGLVAAIPAVIAYNYFLNKVNRMILTLEDFSEELIDYIVK